MFSICPLPLCSCTASHHPKASTQPVLAMLILENAAHLPKVSPLEGDLEERVSNTTSEAHWEDRRRPPVLPRQILTQSEAKCSEMQAILELSSFGKSGTEVLQSDFTTRLATRAPCANSIRQTFEEYSEVSPIL